MARATKQLDGFRTEYEGKGHLFDAFTKRLHDLMTHLLSDAGIRYHIIESRTKSLKSYIDKISRKNHKYSSPITEITDLSALRIIVYYPDDVLRVAEVIDENFDVDRTNSFDGRERLSDSEFGYLSSHFVIGVNGGRSKLPEWNLYSQFKAEIQVRTVLQHAWAAISHELEYKRELDIPSVLKRRLFRLAGLIELADEEFQHTRREHHLLEAEIKGGSGQAGNPSVHEMNLITLENYLENTKSSISKLDKVARKAGFTTIERKEDNTYYNREQFLSDVIQLAGVVGIRSIPMLESFLVKHLNKARPYFEQLIAQSKTEWSTSSEFNLLLLLMTAMNAEQLDSYGGKGWGQEIWERVRETALKAAKK